ncbi:copper-translocating P-type ATPase [Sulfurihydrogenibium azorense]|uniref:copper-translocating P-type ATPase n=1 Tax=Sulfurihydrogenibium azorense TaxID=309806 RepID=UPI00240A4C3F|nr:copper-translocating P-type ATPase [Sulfurihydrogenibium azorense]MDM7272906.1 copper-translocating P-type ATPase [Sulfurihydrogenibium azorense]
MFFHFYYSDYLQFLTASIIQFYAGYEFYKSSLKSLKNRIADMNLLVSIGTFSAYFYSVAVLFFKDFFPVEMRHLYFEGSSAVITFVLIGRYLELKTRQTATEFMKKLISLKPDKAIKLVDGKEEVVDAVSIKKDDVVIVRPGDKIPVDGVVIEGQTEVDQSILTGESKLLYKKEGDTVLSGSINKSGLIKIKAIKDAKDSILNQIIKLLLEAQSKKPKIGKLADKITAYFVPVVLIISILVFDVWYFLGYPLNFSLTAVISVLVIACPCALGLATPITIVNVVGRGAKEGLLFKDPEVIEKSEKIDYVIFDKTGTLTEGKMKVEEYIVKDFLSVFVSLEKGINHPVAQSILQIPSQEVEIKDKQVIVGKGVVGTYKGIKVIMCNKKFLDELNIPLEKEFEEFYLKSKEKGNTVIFGVIDSKVYGVFSISDSVRPESKEVIKTLKDKGIKVVMLTGDNQKVAEKVAKEVGIEEFYYDLTPIDKYNFIKGLKEKGFTVVFVGDGINDAPSMVESDIGIAVETASDLAKESGSIVLLKSDLRGVVKAINLCQKGLKTIKQNLFWAYIYNIIGIPIAGGLLYPFFGILLNPMYAGIAMSFSSITVVLNALKLRYISI